MKKRLFGKFDTGADVYEYTIENENASLSVMTRGATITDFTVFGTSIIGGFETYEEYLRDDSHQGAVIGRVANRIRGARFVMDGVEYNITKNDGDNTLHGGVGFDFRLWTVTETTDTSITLSYVSEDGEEGFPSRLTAHVTYTLSGTDLIIDYKAIPDGKTPIALTNHSYFNLDGMGDTVCDHVATIWASTYTEVDSTLIPTGNHPSVSGTAFDFRTPHKIGERIGGDFIGYDHNFVLSPEHFESFGGKSLGLIAEVSGKALSMKTYTDQPGVQFYIGNFLHTGENQPSFKGGIKRILHGAFCLETQTEPDCINHGIGFYGKGEVYTHSTVYRIEREKA